MGKKHAAIAGTLSVLLALGVSELAAGAMGASSVLAAVGQVVIKAIPQSLEDFVVSTFGLWDKPIFVGLMTVVCAAVGALLGVLGTRSLVYPVAGYLVFGLLGAMAAGTVASAAGAVVPPTAGALAGLGVIVLGGRKVMPHHERRSRRSFLALVAATAALTATGGRWLLTRVQGGPASVQLPTPADPAPPVPPAAQVAGAAPVVTSNESFYRIDILLDPLKVPHESWRLKIGGLVDNPYELGYDELLKIPMVERFVTLTCVSNEVGGDLVGNAAWTGVPLEALLKRARPKPEADFLVSRSVDGFTVGCELSTATDGRTAMVALGMNGQPLPIEHGFPARLVICGLYGYVSATKWLQSLELGTRAAFDADKSNRGRTTRSPIKTESRIDTPKKNESLSAGPRTIAGVAWAQHRGIQKVEVRVDDGPWQEAALAQAINVDTWREWSLPWTATPGPHTLTVRATDGTGEVQTSDRKRAADGGATGWHSVRVNVE